MSNRNLVMIAANPYSGSHANKRRVEELADALRQHTLDPLVVWTAAERAAVVRDPALGVRCRCVVAAGGDGTVGTVINERLSAPLAVMPLGTENLFARQFGFTLEVDTLAEKIAAGRTRAIDLGRVGDRLFSLMLSVGIDAEVVHRMSRWRDGGGALKRITHLNYTRPILDALRRYRYHEVELEADGVKVRGTHAFVFNMPRYALGLRLAPDARPDDGYLDWVVLERPGLVNLMRYACAIARQKHFRLADVRHGRDRSIRITSTAPAAVQADGDPHGVTPVVAEVCPAALDVII